MLSLHAALLFSLSSPIIGQPAAFVGKVVDGAGDGIASAVVWLTGPATDIAPPRLLAEGAADAEGRFSLALTGVAEQADLRLLALAGGHALGYCPCRAGAQAPIEVVCGPATRTTGRIVDSRGDGLAARIVPRYLYSNRPRDAGVHYLKLPPDVAERLSVSTGVDGRFTLTTRPDTGTLGLSVASPDLGERNLWVRTDYGEVTLLPAARLAVHLTCPEAPEATAGVRIAAIGQYREGQGPGNGEAVTDAAGVAHLPPLQPGTALVTPLASADAPWQAEPVRVELKAGETTEVEVPLRAAYAVSGRVFDGAPGTAAAGVQLTPRARASYLPEALPVTDEDGRFHFRALPGEVFVNTPAQNGRPIPYEESAFARMVLGDADASLPDMVLRDGPRVSGTVLGPDGQPAAGAELWGLRDVVQTPLFTDEHGRFSVCVSKLPAEVANDPARRIPVRIWVRSGELMAPEPVEALRGDDVTIRLAAAVACRAKLRVVNPQGEPVPDADVTLSLRNNHFSAPRLTGVTDESGQYESPATWPYGGYVAEIGKIGWSSAQTGIVNAVPGKTLDLGTVTTVEAAGSVSGRVVDADGKPVYWARVSGGGEGPREPVERTDDEGRFCLRELYPGSAWICAIAGNAVGATRCTVGAQDVIIILGPLATGAALRTPAAAVATTGKDADRAVARELTAEAQRRFSPDLLLGTPELLSAWVEVDPDGAAAMSQKQGQYRSQISAALALAAAVEDPEAALQHLQAIGGKALRAVAAVEAAWKASDAGSARASELAQEAVDAARDALQRHDGPIVLARAAEALWESDPAAGEATVREAQAEAEKPRDAWAADGARRAAAEALCRIDLPAALAMADAISNTDTAIGCRLSIAERIAATRPADAEALVAQCLRLRREQDDAGVRYKTGVPRPDEVGPAVGRIAYAMAGVDAGRATGVARSADRPADRARALAHAALGLVGTEPQRAAALFDEALAGPLAAARALGQGPGSELANPALFAHLTCIARRIGYPDAESLCLLALACRTPSAGAAYLPELAFAEPALTATLVADVAEQPWGTQSPPDWGFRGEEQLALAAAAVDASLAADLLRSQPVDAADRQSLDRHARTWGKVMELLLTPAAERYHPVPGAVHTWAPWGRPGG